MLLGLFAAIALLLASVGIYGVMSYGVEQRTHELGIRTALGATRRDTLRLVLLQALRMAAAGIAVGLVASLWLTRLMKAQLFGVKPLDPLTFVTVPAILGWLWRWPLLAFRRFEQAASIRWWRYGTNSRRASTHSYRKATIGSTLAARHAG